MIRLLTIVSTVLLETTIAYAANIDWTPDPCMGGTSIDSAGGTVSGNAYVTMRTPQGQNIVGLQTSMVVPATPSDLGTIFLWPGIQPITATGESSGFLPINNGVLQPVLTWGPTCAPNSPTNSYSSWWISAQYVNTYGQESGFTGCLGGEGMNVSPGDQLDMTLYLVDSTSWLQTVYDKMTGREVSYTIDLKGQMQNTAEFTIEQYSANYGQVVTFFNSSILYDSLVDNCQVDFYGKNDSILGMRKSVDGKACCYDVISLQDGRYSSSP